MMRATKTRTEIDRSQREGRALMREKHRVLALSVRRSAAVAVSDAQRIRASLPRISTNQIHLTTCKDGVRADFRHFPDETPKQGEVIEIRENGNIVKARVTRVLARIGSQLI